MSIPLNNIVKINPGVLDVGNNGNNLFGLMLTKSVGVPAGQTTTFTSADQVGKIFGNDSQEYTLASVYFAGFTNSDRVAQQLYVAPDCSEITPATLTGESLQKVTLDQLRDFTGELTVFIGGVQYSTNDVDLSRVTSFSDAASKLSSALFGNKKTSIVKQDDETETTTEDVTTEKPDAFITYSAASQSMVVTNKEYGEVILASGSLADKLGLTNGVSSLGNEALSFTKLLNKLRQQNLSFCSVFLAWDEKDINVQLELAKWANSTKDDVCVILNDTDKIKATDASTVISSDPDLSKLSLAEQVQKNNYEGVVCVYNNSELCAFIAGYPAAWDLTKADGRFTAAFRRSPLLTANVNDEQEALTLKAKGYNFYGFWASSTSNFTFMYEGRISGQYVWLDSWFCQVWMRRQFQYYFIMTLLARGQIPYNTDGKGILTTAIKPAIDQYLSFGAIRPGVSLADEQVQGLKQAGLNQSQINNITTIGYYLKVDMERVTAQTRVKRSSPPINFWYTDGQSVQQINMNSIEIQ